MCGKKSQNRQIIIKTEIISPSVKSLPLQFYAYLYEKGPPVMLTGIMESLSESALKTSDWPVL